MQLQKDLAEAVGRTPESQPREYPKYEENEELKKLVHEGIYQGAYDVARSGNTSKAGRKEGFTGVKKTFLDKLVAEQPELDMKQFGRYYSSAEKKAIRDMMVKERVRLDGRQLTEIRPIWSEINYLPGAHGSAIFTRGETQSLDHGHPRHQARRADYRPAADQGLLEIHAATTTSPVSRPAR